MLCHLTDEFLVSLLLGIKLLERLLILFSGEFVLLFEVLNLVFTLLQLALQGAAYLALRGQFVICQLFGRFQDKNQGIGGVHILLGEHLGVGQHISLLFHILDVKLIGRNRKRKHAVGLREHRISSLDLNSGPDNAFARDNGSVTAFTPLGLDIALLGLRCRAKRQQHTE